MTISAMRKLPAMLAIVFSCGGVALAQTGGSGAAGAGTGSSVTGGQAAPAAQGGTGTRDSEARKDDKLARGDRKFIEKAAESGMFEVQVSQLAASKATDNNVKSFASMLVDHHTAANNELVQLANARKVELPPAPPRAKRRDMEQMGKKSGAEFDREFVREVGIKAHEKDIKLFEKASKEVKDPQLKAWVDKTLPNLREHLAMAEKLPQSGKGGDAARMGNNRGAAGGGTPTPANKGS
jgi:putative membrane protein